MELRGQNYKVWSDTCLSCIKEFPGNNTLCSFLQIYIMVDQTGTFSTQFQKNWGEIPCSGFSIEASHLFAARIAKEFKRKSEQSFSGCGSARDHGGVARVKYGCDQI